MGLIEFILYKEKSFSLQLVYSIVWSRNYVTSIYTKPSESGNSRDNRDWSSYVTIQTLNLNLLHFVSKLVRFQF